MALDRLTIIKGDSVALRYATDPATDMTGWTCDVQVRLRRANQIALEQELTTLEAGNQAIIGLIQTATLTPDEYLIVAKLAKTSTGEKKEIHGILVVSDSAFLNA